MGHGLRCARSTGWRSGQRFRPSMPVGAGYTGCADLPLIHSPSLASGHDFRPLRSPIGTHLSHQYTLDLHLLRMELLALPWCSFALFANGVPSHDGIANVISRLTPKGFGACFRSWTQAVAGATGGEIIAVDGNSARGSRDRRRGRSPCTWSAPGRAQ